MKEKIKEIVLAIIVLALLVIGIKFVFSATMLVLKIIVGLVIVAVIVAIINDLIDTINKKKGE